MADSILTSVKKTLGLDAGYTAFDLDILLHINSVLSNLNQIGVGPEEGFSIDDASATWDDFIDNEKRLNNVKSFVYLKVRMLFDPPATSFAIEAMERQAREFEYRIYTFVEVEKWQ